MQILDPKYRFNLTLYLEKGFIKFNNLTVSQLSSLIYPYFKKYRVKEAGIEGDSAVVVLAKGNKRVYLEIEIIN